MNNIEEFKMLVTSIQSIAVTVALIIGAIWALYQFFSLKKVRSAQANLDKIISDLEQQSKIQVVLKTGTLGDSTSGSFYINVIAEITNLGNKSEVLLTNNAIANCILLDHSGYEEPAISDSIEGWHQTLNGNGLYVIGSGIKTHIEFIFPITKEGVYLLDITIPGSKEEMDRYNLFAEEAGYVAHESEEGAWGATTYFDTLSRR